MADFIGNNWEVFMLGIKQTCSVTKGKDVEMEIVYQKLLQTFERKASLLWHIKYFEQYIAENFNPKGLRGQVFLNIWAHDPDLKTQWKLNLQQSSKKMMDLMIEYYMKELKSVDCEIKQIYDENILILNKPDFGIFDIRLKEYIQAFTRELLQKKRG